MQEVLVLRLQDIVDGFGWQGRRTERLLSGLDVSLARGIQGMIGLSLRLSFGVRAGRSGWATFPNWSNSPLPHKLVMQTHHWSERYEVHIYKDW
jgi:hypothetical protein